MAHDGKYGKVDLEFGEIGEDEPVVVFRGRDKVLPDLLLAYYNMCKATGSPEYHLGLIEHRRQKILQWQADPDNGARIPSSQGSAGQTYWERNK